MMEKDAKIYVAGHRGLVGAAIVRKLKADGYENLVYKTHKELDLTRQADVEQFFETEKPVYAIVAAAKVGGIHANSVYPADFIGINLQIQVNLIEAAHKNAVKKILFLGSSCIYPKFAPQPITEDSLLTGPLEPTNEWYAIAKIAGIKMCQAYRIQVRPFELFLLHHFDTFVLQRPDSIYLCANLSAYLVQRKAVTPVLNLFSPSLFGNIYLSACLRLASAFRWY